LLTVPNPEYAVGDAPTPASNPVSQSLGDRNFGSDPGYPVIFPLGPSAGTLADKRDITLGGLTFATGTPPSVFEISNTNTATTAVSMFDFNLFRWNVIQTVDILDQKIRDMLDIMEPTCPV